MKQTERVCPRCGRRLSPNESACPDPSHREPPREMYPRTPNIMRRDLIAWDDDRRALAALVVHFELLLPGDTPLTLKQRSASDLAHRVLAADRSNAPSE